MKKTLKTVVIFLYLVTLILLGINGYQFYTDTLNTGMIFGAMGCAVLLTVINAYKNEYIRNE